MKDNLQDPKYYEKVNRNPLTTMIFNLKQFMKKVNPAQTDIKSRKERAKNNKINIDVENKHIARAYGLVKAHKKNFPLRIIVSAIDSPLHEFSKLLKSAITRGCPKPKSHIKDSWTFKRMLKDIIIPQGWIFVKLDVQSMFTNISLELILRAIDKRWNDIENHTSLNKEEFMEAVTLVFDNAFIQFDNEFYRQILGASMGLPLSPIVCDLVLEDAEKECLRSIHEKYNWDPIIFNRFVDDIFAIIPENQVDNFVNEFNKYNINLKFTIEIEENHELPFLDMLMINDNGKLITDWYQKPTQSLTYLNFNAHNPITQKKATIYNLVDRGKDKIEHGRKTHVVYQLDCLNCSKKYIGQTTQFLRKRVLQHKNNINSRTQQPNVLTLHRLEDGHEFDWENPKILDTEHHYNKRLISEMFQIQLEDNSLNIREDTKKLNSLYKNFFIDFHIQKKFK
ncbi:hypothetical protein QAD02_010698 [Eretmocerus hayati]|uniref:Uncharacterized protein n=1 Tax=Eretmocerus hayati TaxID=131215 RepID=A0ACC2NV04_9HYME|nr:hypothetical protein QAD02_010698 [Eretmocerus hayati]